MKKIILTLAAVAALGMVSCVKDEQDPNALIPEEKPVEKVDYSVLKLNELYGAATAEADKFIEIYNTGTKDIDLENVTLTKDEELTWTGSKGQVIKAGGWFAIVGAKGSTPDGFSSGFSAKKSVIVELVDPEGNVLDTFQRGEKGTGWGDQTLDSVTGSWSRVPDGTGRFVLTENPTVGAKNDTNGTEDPTLVGNGDSPVVVEEPSIVLNELCGLGLDKDKFIELYNPGSKEVSLAGYTINKDEGKCWTGAADAKIPAKGFFAIVGAKNSTPDGISSGFSAKKSVIIELFDADGKKIDTFQRGEKGTGWGDTSFDEAAGSWSRIPDGTGKFKVAEATPGAANKTEGTDDATVIQ